MNLSIGKLFALLVFTPLILGVSVLVEHGAAECFYEMLKIGEKLSISFDVDMEGGYDITFYVIFFLEESIEGEIDYRSQRSSNSI